jgi:hypothetical protein
MSEDDENEVDAHRGLCPECGSLEKLLPEGDIRAHIHAKNGEFCAGSRGMPK